MDAEVVFDAAAQADSAQSLDAHTADAAHASIDANVGTDATHLDADVAPTDATIDAAAECPAPRRECSSTCVECPTEGVTETACVFGECRASACADGSILAFGRCVGPDSPEAAPLFDPERFSTPYECSGTALTTTEVLALFERGHGALALSGDEHRMERHCTAATGCSEITTTVSTSVDIGVLLARADGEVDYLPNPDSGGYATHVREGLFTPLDGRSELVLALWTPEEVGRIRITHGEGGSACISITLDYSTPDQTAYAVWSTTLASPEAGSDPAAGPPFDSGSACDGTTLTNAEIFSTWFESGAASANLSDRAGLREFARRRCHPYTGCTAWEVASSSSSALSPAQFNVSGIDLSIDLYGSSGTQSLPVVAGLYHGDVFSLKTYAIDGVVTATCTGYTAQAEFDANESVYGFGVSWNFYDRVRSDR